MNMMYDPKEMEGVTKARDSFNGRLLTDAQFDEAMSVTGIIEREIYKTGRFKEKLGDYAFAFARSEKFDVAKSETMLRDLFKERVGQSMNQIREGLQKNEEALTEEQRRSAYSHAADVGKMVETGNKIAFHRAYAYEAAELATHLKITDVGAKNLMKEQFEAVEGRDFYDTMKKVEEDHYRPQIEAEKAERKAQKEQQQSQSTAPRSRTRSYG